MRTTRIRSIRARILSTTYFVAILCASAQVLSQTIGQKAASKYRQSVVFLTVNKITSTGAVVQEFGTAFVVSDLGHLITSCHVVDKKILDAGGNPTPDVVDKIEIQGAVASRNGTLEPITLLHCAQGSYDLALLKFKNTALKRLPIPVSIYSKAEPGSSIASMGFPLNTEFFVRQGTIGGPTEDDTLTVDLTLNPGDSGSPVLNDSLQVVAVAEAGYSGAGIGIARPIRHGAGLLSEAGVILTATNVEIATTPLAGVPLNLNVAAAAPEASVKAFASATSKIPADAASVKVTYAVSRFFSTPDILKGSNRTDQFPGLAISEVSAKPGYKIIDAKFIVTGSDGANVININPSLNGTVARVAFQKLNTEKFDPDKASFVRGFVETTQEKIR